MTRRKTYFVQAIIFLCLSFASIFGCSTRSQALHRLKEMKAADYFSTQPQIDLANAITEGDTNKMQMLIADGANVNYLGNDSMMPLFWAIAKQNFRTFKFLLDHGANPDAIANTHHLSQYSALTLAAIFNDSKYLQELLAHGANPNAPVGNAHKTAIFFAVSNDRSNNISILLKYGAKIDFQIINGYTPLHEAIGRNLFSVALFLYRAGANPLIKDRWGYSPIDSIKKFGDNGYRSDADEKAYKQLLEEFRKAGLLDKS